jgi:hypothetical protein
MESGNQIMTENIDSVQTPSVGTFTDDGSKKTLWIDSKNYIELTQNFVKIQVKGNYYGIDLENANYYSSPYNEFGYLYIKLSTSQEAEIKNGKLFYGDKIYNMAT